MWGILCDYVNILILAETGIHYFYHTWMILAWIYYYYDVIKCWFSDSTMPLPLLFVFLLKGELSISFIYLYQCGLLYSYFIQSVTILYYYYLFWWSDRPRFGQWEHLQDVSCIFLMCPHHPLSIFLIFGMRCSMFILFLPPSPPFLELTISPRSPGSVQWNVI